MLFETPTSVLSDTGHSTLIRTETARTGGSRAEEGADP